ncbi:PRC and DUF2382 domain-containing protein [Streptomyces sp. HSW2009]|uniref:PRC and DUF2382 domain-containing protein n=1 Tax=Streptomyces sp. HSW2009 TaxID=3142890 RepID=UPI0032EE03F8
MTAPRGDTPQELSGMHVVDPDGQKVGSVQQVYSDDITGVPEWITVRTGLFGMKETFVPLAGAQHSAGDLRVPYSKEEIKDAPRIDAAGHLSPEEETELYRHYGLRHPTGPPAGRGGQDTATSRDARAGRSGMAGEAAAGAAGGAAGGGAAGYAMGRESGQRADAGGPKLVGAGAGRGAETGDAMAKESASREAKDSADMRAASGMKESGGMKKPGDMQGSRGMQKGPAAKEGVQEMILSEEQVRIGTEEHESGRARLRKHVVTENVSRTVPVSHEEVHLTREPITADDMRRQGRTARIEDGTVEVTLHEERAVVHKETVPVERVRLETERVTEQQEVSTQIRKETVEYEGSDGTGRGRRGMGKGDEGSKEGPEGMR